MTGPQILKGIGKINGDGWKDRTTSGEIVFVWNRELSTPPFAPGQYPRVGAEHWSASTKQFDFFPATIDEVQALFQRFSVRDEMLEILKEYVKEEWTEFSDEELHDELALGNEMVRNHIAARAAIAKAEGRV